MNSSILCELFERMENYSVHTNTWNLIFQIFYNTRDLISAVKLSLIYFSLQKSFAITNASQVFKGTMLQPCDQDLLPETWLSGLGWDLNQLEPILWAHVCGHWHIVTWSNLVSYDTIKLNCGSALLNWINAYGCGFPINFASSTCWDLEHLVLPCTEPFLRRQMSL